MKLNKLKYFNLGRGITWFDMGTPEKIFDVSEFIKLIDKLLGEYVEKNSIDLVLNKKDILMGKNNYNITEEILKMVNNTN